MTFSSSFPPPSILSNTEDIINACEDAEVNSSGLNVTLDVILVTQLAALIHAEKYHSALHLYSRYSSLVDSSFVPASASTSLTLEQFGLLWKAVTPLLDVMTNNDTNEKISNVFASLQLCMGMQMQPLATYTEQLMSSLRDQIAYVMEVSLYESVSSDECAKLLGFSFGCGRGGINLNMSQYLKNRNWTMESPNLWIPNNSNDNDISNDGKYGGAQTDRIEHLTKIISFMETQRLNA